MSTGADGATTANVATMSTSGQAPTTSSAGGSSPGGSSSGDTSGSTTGDTGPADGCFDDAECAPDVCMPPGEERCTQCNYANPTCVEDHVCQPGDVCIEVRMACPCDYMFTTICSPACTSNADCGDGVVCHVDSGHCVDQPCTVDDDCLAPLVCADAVGGDACRWRRCDTDDDCDGLLCVSGSCHESPGACVVPGN